MDMALEIASRAKDGIAARLARAVEKEKMTAEAMEATLSLITPVAYMEAMGEVDLVIEAVSEDLALKLKIFSALDGSVGAGTILASNTSSVSITRLAGATKRPDRVVGMHFMNPAPVMALVEVIPGLQTSPETVATVRRVAEAWGKTATTSRDFPGFVVNRLLIPFLNEACEALTTGVGTVEDIDTSIKLGLAHPMGPFQLADLIGLDTVLAISRVLYEGYCDPKYRPNALLVKYVEAGWLGRKTGRGFYTY